MKAVLIDAPRSDIRPGAQLNSFPLYPRLCIDIDEWSLSLLFFGRKGISMSGLQTLNGKEEEESSYVEL